VHSIGPGARGGADGRVVTRVVLLGCGGVAALFAVWVVGMVLLVVSNRLSMMAVLGMLGVPVWREGRLGNPKTVVFGRGWVVGVPLDGLARCEVLGALLLGVWCSARGRGWVVGVPLGRCMVLGALCGVGRVGAVLGAVLMLVDLLLGVVLGGCVRLGRVGDVVVLASALSSVVVLLGAWCSARCGEGGGV